MYCSFEGGKVELSGKEANWNFIHSFTRMHVDRPFETFEEAHYEVV